MEQDQKNANDKTHEYRDYQASVSFFRFDKRPPLLRPLAWRILITIIVLVALTLVGLLAGTSFLEAAPAPKPASRPATQEAGSPLVLAFYYSWFDENSWNYDILSDLPSEQYVSRDRAVMGRHIEQAQNAGIDAFMLAWYGPAGGTNQTESNLSAMLDEAAARGFRVGILFETDGPFFGDVGDVTAALQHARDTHFNHPAYLRVDGRPVVFYWRPTIYGVETWRNIRAQSDPGYESIWISEGVDTAYLDVFDGHHLYSNTWNPPANLHAVNQRYAGEVAAARDRLGAYKFWVATVMPGYDDVRIRPGAGGFAQDREGGAYYTRAWDAAIASNPNWIVINSFNEWPEGSYIEPSVAHGDLYMSLTAQHSAQFKSGGGTAVALDPPAPAEPPPGEPEASEADTSEADTSETESSEPEPEPEPTPEPDSPTAFVDVAALNLRAGPSVDFPVLTQLSQGAALPITGQHPAAAEWWQVELDNQTGWVHREFVHSGGPLEQVGTLDDAALPALEVTAAEAEPEGDTLQAFAATAHEEIDEELHEDVADDTDVESRTGVENNTVAENTAAENTATENTSEALTAEQGNLSASAQAADNSIRTGEVDTADMADQATAAAAQDATLGEITVDEAVQAVAEAIQVPVNPLWNPAQDTLYPHLSR